MSQTVGVTANPAEHCDVYFPTVDFMQAGFQKTQLEQATYIRH